MTTYLQLKSLYSNKTFVALIIGTMLIATLLPIVTKADTTIPLCEITRGLTMGSSGDDVRCLQRYLNWAGYPVALSGVGSVGNETTYFGSLTANAVTRWQNANSSQVLLPAGLATGTGYFGPLSFNWYVTIVKTNLGV